MEDETVQPPGHPTWSKTSSHPTEILGKYRILQLLGEGGMGEVYEADQLAPVRRRVALKLIKKGMDSESVVKRFEIERQALALMNHPTIARVYDAGTTDEGRPYFAMEHVKGVPVTQYCDAHRLNTRERIDLFLQICEGIQHAHQKGIIHRDIKPSNVMVKIQDGKPLPKIIDFGVAKATSQRLTEKTMFTEMGQLVGTPEYMSPEQAEMSGLDVDTRTDVYSLGALLYELLVGSRPFDSRRLRRAGFDEIRRIIREDEPQKPSKRLTTNAGASDRSATRRRTDSHTLTRQIRGDLDWIVMKALEKDRTRRYDSASDLAADLTRFRRDEPVLARPPSTTYRIHKFVRRHRAGVFAGAVVVVALIAGVALSGAGLVRARRAEKVARDEAVRAADAAATSEQVSDFLVGLFHVLDPGEARGNTITAREILDQGAMKIREELNDQPEIQARMMTTMGNVYQSLGLYDEAERLLEQGLARRQEVLGRDHPDVATSLSDLGYLLWLRGDYDRAREIHERALAVREAALGPEHPDVATSLNNLGNVISDAGDLAGARPLYERALAIREAALGAEHSEVAATLNNLAAIHQLEGDYPQARELYERALAIDRKALGPTHHYVASGWDNLGSLLQEMGDFLGARPMHERALEIRESVLGPDHPHVATSLINIGTLLMKTEDLDEAADRFERALRIFRASLGENHADVAMTLSQLGAVSLARDDPETARELFEQARAIYAASLGPEHPETAAVLFQVALSLEESGDRAAAGPRFLRALDIVEAGLGPDHPRLVPMFERYAAFLDASSRGSEAEVYRRRAQQIRRDSGEP